MSGAIRGPATWAIHGATTMRHRLALAGAAALALISTPLLSTATLAQTASSADLAKVGRLVVSSDGKRLGRIDKVDGDRVGMIVDGRYVYVPTASLSAGENNRVMTSLTFKDATRR